MKLPSHLHGLMVEFATPQEVLHAVRRARQAGYRHMDAYTPYTVDGLATELGQRRSTIPATTLIAALVGAGVGYCMQYYTIGIDYPLNVGGRPYNSWPVFMPVTFELMVLTASLGAFLGMLFLNGLPQPHHPVFNVPRFAQASQDAFFLCIEATDPSFDLTRTADFLASLGPRGEVYAVPRQQPVANATASEIEREEVPPMGQKTAESDQ
jgi:hypothetical protein